MGYELLSMSTLTETLIVVESPGLPTAVIESKATLTLARGVTLWPAMTTGLVRSNKGGGKIHDELTDSTLMTF